MTMPADDPEAERRRVRNNNRLNDMYAGVVMAPFESALEEWEFWQNFPNSAEAQKPRPEV